MKRCTDEFGWMIPFLGEASRLWSPQQWQQVAAELQLATSHGGIWEGKQPQVRAKQYAQRRASRMRKKTA